MGNMDILNTCIFAALGALFGALITAVYYRSSVASLRARSELEERMIAELSANYESAQYELGTAREEVSRLVERVQHYEERISEQHQYFQEVEGKLSSMFKSLSAETLKSTTEQFSSQFNSTAKALLEQMQGTNKSQIESGHKLLDTLGRSISEKLVEVDRTVKDLEKLRIAGDTEIKKQIEQLVSVNQVIGNETSKLSSALSNSRVQGVWGERQLRNVVEAAGMVEYCDFSVQCAATALDGSSARADMLVRLPNGLRVAIDAKTPTKAFLEAIDAPNGSVRAAKMKELAAALRGHIRAMAKRDYPKMFAPALEYTLVFLPSESLFLAAVEEDSELLSYAESQKVVLTTPLSLIAFLRAVSCGWTQVRVQQNASEIQRLGKELFERQQRFMERFGAVGRGLENAVRSYNDAVGTSRQLNATRRKFAELGTGASEQVEDTEEVTSSVRIVETSLPDVGSLLSNERTECEVLAEERTITPSAPSR
jgi:DNA recombination protein RmuC